MSTVTDRRTDLLYRVLTLGRGHVRDSDMQAIRTEARAIVADMSGKVSTHTRLRGKLWKDPRNKVLLKLASKKDYVVYQTIDSIRDQRLKGRLAGREHTHLRYQGEAFVSIHAEEGADRLREARQKQRG